MRLALIGILVALVTGCQTTVRDEDPCRTDENSAACICKLDPESDLCQCKQEPTLPGCLCVLQPHLAQCEPEPACPDVAAATHVREGLLLLSDGAWRDGRRRIECALEAEPRNSRALTVLEQLDSEPESYLRQRFGDEATTHIVRSEDTLGRIADMCLGDPEVFVALARLNSLDRPSTLFAGQQLRIVGTSSCMREPIEEPADPRTQALEAETRGELESALELIEQAREAAPEDTSVAAHRDRIRASYLAELKDRGYELQDAGRNQQACDAWARVLELEPDDFEARLNHRRLCGS